MDERNEYARLHGNAVGHRRTGRPVLRFVGAGTFFHAAMGPASRAPALEAAERFRKAFPDAVRDVYDPAAGALRPLGGPDWRARAAVDAPGGGTTIVLRGGADISPCAFSAYLQGSDAGDVPGASAIDVPLPWIAEDPDRCVAEVAAWCEGLQPEQGTFGIGTAAKFFVAPRTHGRELWPWLARFSGFDTPTALRYGTAGPHRAIRAVNWLTVLDDAWIARLGGTEAIAAALHPEGAVHPYRGGAVIRACTHPQMGDVNLGGAPEAYVAVDRLVRPFRYLAYNPAKPMEALKVPEPLDPAEATLEWVTRFERLDPAREGPVNLDPDTGRGLFR